MLVLPEMFDPMLFSIAQHAFPVKLPTHKDPEVSGLYKSEAVGCSEDVSLRYEGSTANVLEFPGGLVTNLHSQGRIMRFTFSASFNQGQFVEVLNKKNPS